MILWKSLCVGSSVLGSVTVAARPEVNCLAFVVEHEFDSPIGVKGLVHVAFTVTESEGGLIVGHRLIFLPEVFQIRKDQCVLSACSDNVIEVHFLGFLFLGFRELAWDAPTIKMDNGFPFESFSFMSTE